jgi:hypothetical protein
MAILIDHGSRLIRRAGLQPRLLHEVSTRWSDQNPRRLGYRRVRTWRSRLLGLMQVWTREFALAEPEGRAIGQHLVGTLLASHRAHAAE